MQPIFARYIVSRRGTQLVFYKFNTYTPNSKLKPESRSRDWKCSMYHKAKCKARLVTKFTSADVKRVLFLDLKRIRNEPRRTNKDILPVVNIETKPSLAAAMHTNRDLVFIPGQREHEATAAVYSATSRGRIQLIYGGQPFIFEKKIKLATNEEKKYWRCNQWWNQKCRSRVCTINDMVFPLNRYHTHEEIVRRKKRVRKNASTEKIVVKSDSYDRSADTATTSGIDVMHLKYEEIVADVTEIVEPTPYIIAKKD